MQKGYMIVVGMRRWSPPRSPLKGGKVSLAETKLPFVEADDVGTAPLCRPPAGLRGDVRCQGCHQYYRWSRRTARECRPYNRPDDHAARRVRT